MNNEADQLALHFSIFMGVKLRLAPGVLVPRSETEILGHAALKLAREIRASRIIDVCCGSGNLSCALAANLPEAIVWSLDLSDQCVGTTSINVHDLALGDRVKVMKSDLFSALQNTDLAGKVELIVCNPPYIPTKSLETEKRSLLENEPREAFDGGPYGINIIQRLIKDAANFLRGDCPLCFEFGAGQDAMVKRLLDRSELYHSIRFASDANGIARVAISYRKAL